MERHTCIVVFFLVFSITGSGLGSGSGAGRNHQNDQPRPPQSVKLFVFGDSYADTGNWPKSSFAISWKQPFGITFPGKPSGRFSDGRVLTDYIASFLGIRSPLPYTWRKFGEKVLPYGVNFACGGTGVFDTLVQEPNMTAQIDNFQQLLEENVYTKQDLNSSIALVSLAGNDYATYLASNGTQQGLPNFTESVINQIGTNLKRIHELGVRKVAVTGIEPLGCLPQFTASTLYQNCSSRANLISQFHNQLLNRSVGKLNNETREQSVFVILDLYNAFMSALEVQENHIPAGGSLKFENPLKPCCEGVAGGYGCGNVDKNTGTKKYTVCDNPKLSFFWDVIHPSHQGWLAVSSALQSSLNLLIL